MRKSVLFSLAALATLSACKKSETSPASEATTTVSMAPAGGSEVANPDPAHDSQNSLDWPGTYTGKLPCASCPGIDTKLVLNDDGSYELNETYLESGEKPIHTKGKFTWGGDKSTIKLDAAADGASYKVGEGQLWRLDTGGKEVTGELAANYVLKKSS